MSAEGPFPPTPGTPFLTPPDLCLSGWGCRPPGPGKFYEDHPFWGAMRSPERVLTLTQVGAGSLQVGAWAEKQAFCKISFALKAVSPVCLALRSSRLVL